MITFPPKRYLLPNLFTFSATFCGFSAVWLATQATTAEHFYGAASLVCLAVFLDGFDGRIARWVDAQSRIGGQLDSLSDFLCFGVAPAVLVYAWGLRSLGVFGLLVAFSFAASAMLRLARFNVTAEEGSDVGRFFAGLPAPMGGLGLALVVGINSGVLGRSAMVQSAKPSLAILVVLVALLMISNVPFRTFKDLRPTWQNRLMIAAILAVQVVVSIRIDYMVALSLGLIGYMTFNLCADLAGAARVRRVRAQADGTLLDDD